MLFVKVALDVIAQGLITYYLFDRILPDPKPDTSTYGAVLNVFLVQIALYVVGRHVRNLATIHEYAPTPMFLKLVTEGT